VDDRQLVEDTGDRGGVRRVGVYDGGSVRGVVQVEVEVELGGRQQRALDHLAGKGDDAHLLRGAIAQHHAGAGDPDQVVAADRHVAGRADEQALGREPTGRCRHVLSKA
jgi:hypothetical protein